ncbi:MAG: Uma2 family endonuclease [Desulfomicrobium escambiense]|nr:Uma2 family endonuclease [Desulfomicrobium escambiense]
MHLGADILVPDLAGWRRGALPVMPETAYFTLPPDWVCEVLSPGTARVDRADKMPIYAEHGVSFLWLIDPAPRTLEVFILREGTGCWSMFISRMKRFAPCLLEAVAFSLEVLWA